jgi:putative acetyltransferase
MSELDPGGRIRPIAPPDDPVIASIIRTVMPEFGADGPGFAIVDPEVDSMSAAYSGPRSRYYVAELDSRVVGGAGFGPLTGASPEVCELRKMYFLPEGRGRGLGAGLLAKILAEAAQLGYRTCYLETLTGMEAAQRLYGRAGFRPRHAPMGQTGHFGCDRWYVRDLGPRDEPSA